MMAMKFNTCCEWLGRSIQECGCGGQSVILDEKLFQRPMFILQCRAIGHDEVNNFTNFLSEIPSEAKSKYDLRSIHLCIQTALHYCPSCGANLVEWIDGHQAEVERIIAETKHLSVTS